MVQQLKDCREPIAVVGIGCRMPGDVRNPSDLWRLIMSKRIANTNKVPKSRFNIDAYLHPSNERPGSFNVPGGCFLEDDLQDFDPGLFNISPIEALWMDPQQRKLLEVVYEAFESCGITISDIAGCRTGCFVGSFTSDFQQMMNKEPDFRHAYAACGVDPGILGNRISYVFDLKGPSFTVNTACSSSLYALDAACKAIWACECDSAIVGGTNLILTVDQHLNTAKLGVLSPTNQCHTFDESADGYSRAEGVGALYLKTLSSAVRDGDPVRAVIRSTATASNGKCNSGLTHPSTEGQTDVIALAYKLGNLSLEDTNYVECHGTGTPVGDPIEVEAVARAMGHQKSRTRPILIGSAASSIGTIIKTVLALENGIIPPTAGIKRLSTSIPWDDFNIKVVTEPTFFSSSIPLRRIGISAFGYGGTNAHAVLECSSTAIPGYRRHKSMKHAEGIANGLMHVDPDADRPHLLSFSAHDEPTLKNNITDYSTRLSEADMIDLAYSFGLRRTKFPQRAFAVARKESLELDIRAARSRIISAPIEKANPAFVFTGQGAQWAQMGVSLLKTFPSVLQTIRALDQDLSELKAPPSWKIETMITKPKDANIINEPEYAQPLCTAVQIAIVDLMAHWGIKPSAVIGHSSGEIAAGYAAGLTSAQSAITAAYFRGKVAASLRTDGAMLAVGARSDDLLPYLNKTRGKIDVACYNSPESTTLSGDRDAIDQLKSHLGKNIFTRVLRTGGKAYHSHHMKDGEASYLRFSQNESNRRISASSKVPMFSTVTAKQIDSDMDTIPDDYWAKNLSSPVLFTQSIQLMLSEMPSINLLIEIGPHPALAGPLRQILQATNNAKVGYLSTLKREEHDGDRMLGLAGHLWEQDASIDVNAVTSVESFSRDGSIMRKTGLFLVDLPTYHWTYSKPCWTEPRFSEEHRQVKEPRHDLLGRRIIGMTDLEPAWRNVLRQKDLPWLSQHLVGGEVMLPATGYLALAMEAITQLNDQSAVSMEIRSYTMRDVVISAATVVTDDDAGTEIMFRLQPLNGCLETSKNSNTSHWYQFIASCSSYGAWKETARGKVALNVRSRSHHNATKELEGTCDRVDFIDWLDKFRTVGFNLGPAFHHIRSLLTNGESQLALGDIAISKTCSTMHNESRYVLHPTVLDSCLQPMPAATHRGRINDLRCGTIPTHFGEATIFRPSTEQLLERCMLQVWTPQLGNRAYQSNSQFIAYNGELLADFISCRHLLYSTAVPQDMRGNLQKDLYMKLDWRIDSDYLGWATEAGNMSERPIASIVDLLVHKKATTRVLCFDTTIVPSILAARPTLALIVATPTDQVKATLSDQYSEHENLAFVTFDISSEAGQLGEYDLVILGKMMDAEPHILEHVRGLIAAGGHLLLPTTLGMTSELEHRLKNAGFLGINEALRDDVILSSVTAPKRTINITHVDQGSNILLVYRDAPTSLLSIISYKLKSDGWKVKSRPISSLRRIDEQQAILVADAEGPFLTQITEDQLCGLINLTETVSAITWVTCGGLLTGHKPEFGMTAGAARVLRKEKESLDLVTLDYDAECTSEHRVAALLSDVAERQRTKGRNGETEYCFKNGVVHIGRLVSHHDVNHHFVPDQSETMMLHQRDHPAVRGLLEAGKVRFHMDDARVAEPLDAKDVEVHVEAIGLSSSDGADDTSYLSHEIAGTVTRVGSKVTTVAPGAHVAGLAFDNLATFQRTPANLVQELPSHCSAIDGATLPSAFATAIYGLEELAMIKPGENVAINSDLGPVALAAAQLCDALGANPIIVISSTTDEKFNPNSEVLSSVKVVSDRDGNIAAGVAKVTGGTKLNVLMCSATSTESLVIECGQLLAPFGRILTVGHSINFASAILGFSSQIQGISSFQFELKNVAEQQQHILARVLERCMTLYRERRIKPLSPLLVKKPAEVQDILQSIPLDVRAGKYVVSYAPEVSFKTVPSRAPLRFRNNVTYLLVGCLGGLGRQVASWMVERGAKHLAFVSRTGIDNPAAAKFVESLSKNGVEALPLRADITCCEDVARAVSQINPMFPIRGVLNAASVFHDVVFHNMKIEAWRNVADTKVKGCLNLHDVLKDEPLDFFVMTSSIASTLGSAGQSNYGAANSFLDSLACHRRSRGLPAVSLILPAIFGIGYISEHPELEHSIKSKGMYGIYKNEMLEAFEVAMTPNSTLPEGVDHIIAGIQPRRLGRAIRASGAHMPWNEDPRLNWLEMAVSQQRSTSGAGRGAASTGSTEHIVAAIQQATSMDQAIAATTAHIARGFARLLMLDADAVQATQKAIGSLGLDSMVGAEFRNWIFREFAVDVPFQQLLAGSMTIADLATDLCARVKERN